jgi:uncharacterized protein YqfA (UPF0365 family)
MKRALGTHARESRAEGRRLPLMASFGTMSLLLTLVLGGVLGVQIHRLVAKRSVSVLTKTTQSAIAITLNTLESNGSYGRDGVADTVQQETAQIGLAASASRSW